jgi:hypothetical protein
MSNAFDELTKGLAVPVPRREALRRMGTFVAGAVLGLFGLKRPDQAGAAAVNLQALCTSACYPCRPVTLLQLRANPHGYANCIAICVANAGNGLATCGVCNGSNLVFCQAGQVCQAGRCVTPCLGDGGNCTTNTQCCNKSCQGGKCCLGIGNACTKNAQCCSGSCGTNFFGPGTVCCVPKGGPCNLDNPGACCSGICFNASPNPVCG